MSPATSLATAALIALASGVVLASLSAATTSHEPRRAPGEIVDEDDEDAKEPTTSEKIYPIEAMTSFMAGQGHSKSQVTTTTQIDKLSITSRTRPTTTTPRAVLHRSEKRYKYDYLSMQSFVATDPYFNEACLLLSAEFPFLTREGVRACMVKHKSHYAVCHDQIIASLKGSSMKPASQSAEDKEILQYESVQSALGGEPLTRAQKEGLERLLRNNTSGRKGWQRFGLTRLLGNNKKSYFHKERRRPKPTPARTDPILTEEYEFAQQRLREWQTSVENRIKRTRNQELARQNNTAVECACCFDSFALGDMIKCLDKGHLFCVDCLKSFVENQIFGLGNLGVDKFSKQPALELKCMHGDGCSSGFTPASLEMALPVKTLRKYEEIQFQLNIERAGISGDMCTCPKCEYRAALPESVKIFSCPVSDCRFDSCRLCGEAAHVTPARCKEVEERETKGRLTVEEAISAVKIRTCPKCKKGFVKTEGCNHIDCSCGASVCYVCRKVMQGYEHFCRKSGCNHTSCGKCPKYTSEEDDARAMREAGVKAAAKAGFSKADVEKMLKN